ncbi:MAG: hypothetical protein Q9191_002688 [Dirinaria sp. TL-2023a]
MIQLPKSRPEPEADGAIVQNQTLLLAGSANVEHRPAAGADLRSLVAKESVFEDIRACTGHTADKGPANAEAQQKQEGRRLKKVDPRTQSVVPSKAVITLEAPPSNEKEIIFKDISIHTDHTADKSSAGAEAQHKQEGRQLNKNDRRTQSVASSEALITLKNPRSTAFTRKDPVSRRRHFEPASDIMKRILDDKSSEVPTSVIAARTRAAVSSGRIGLRWNDKAYGYLAKFVAKGKVGAVRECLKAGCNPGTEKKPRWWPIYNAVRGASDEHLKCLRKLVLYDADVNVRQSRNRRTPLHYAVESKRWKSYSSVIYTLLAHGADLNARDMANDLPLLMLLVGNGRLPQEKRNALFLLLAPNFQTNLNVTLPGTLDNPLHLAIRRKDAYTVDAILGKMKQIGGSTLDLMMYEYNGSGFTPLLLALTIFQLGEDLDEELQIIEYLLKHGASVDDAETTQGKTPLHLVIGVSKNTIALGLLCRRSANPDLPDFGGQTPRALSNDQQIDS